MIEPVVSYPPPPYPRKPRYRVQENLGTPWREVSDDELRQDGDCPADYCLASGTANPASPKGKQYRIIQTAQALFGVQEVRYSKPLGFWPWQRKFIAETWVAAAVYVEKIGNTYCPLPRRWPTQEAAQKWVDDQRNYPAVVKQPA